MHKPIKIAQIGIGHNHGDATMEALRRFPEHFDVVAVAEDDAAWRAKRKDLPVYEGLRWMAEDEVLLIPGLEAVCVEKDVPDLIRVVKKCVERGLHVRMDKPTGEGYAEFEACVRLAQRKNLAFQVAYMYRYNPYIAHCMEMVETGALGEIFEIDAQMSSTHPAPYRDWLGQYQGGDMYIFGSHLIDLIVCMLGEPERVTPFLYNSFPEVSHCVDNGLAVLEYPRATCTVRCTSMEANGYYRRQLVVCGTKGTVEIKPLERPTKMSIAMAEPFCGNEIHTNGHADARRFIELASNGKRYDAQLLDFARIVRGEGQTKYGYEHELAVHRTTLRACGYAIEKGGK